MDNKIFKLKKKELERLGRSEEDIELVMKCQNILPILFNNNDIAKYSINAIDLWNQIGSKNHFYDWAKTNILKSDNVSSDDYIEIFCRVKSWEENKRTKRIDINVLDKEEANGLNRSLKSMSANGITTSYLLTLDIAKDIVMYIGALPRTNKKTKEISQMYRKYFRIIEDIVIENKEWLAIRDPEKQEYKNMSSEIEQWIFRIWHRKAYKSEYSVEANMINKIATGKTSQELKLELGISTYDLLRDYLKKNYNEELLFLERQNQVLLRMDMGFTERTNMLTKMYEVTFKDKKMQAVA